MPKIIKNNIVYGSGAKYVELTQLQYDQLTDAEKHNGKMYFITDANGDGQDFQPVIYSTSEREIGVWVDGKPLYEISLPFNTVSSATSDVDTSALSIESLASYNFSATGNTYYYSGSDFVRGYFTDATNSTFRVVSGSSYPRCSGYVTLQYTKTTDVAGSGTWTPQGVPTSHYSTYEHIIGTWVDGSTLFEKTMNPTCSVGDNTLNHNISNFGKLVSIEGVCKYNNGSEYLYLPYTSTSSSYTIYISNVTSTTYKVGVGSGFSSIQDCYVTIRYTKTS